MVEVIGVLIVFSVPIILAAAVVMVLNPALYSVVQELCGTAIRARFWTVYLSLTLVLVSVLGITHLAAFSPDLALIDLFRKGAYYGLLALTLGVLAIGAAIWIGSIEQARLAGAAVEPARNPGPWGEADNA